MTFESRTQKVLVVEHDRAILEMIELRLAVAGYEPYMARTGECAVETLKTMQPDGVILDWNLRDMDGLSVLRAVNPRAERLPYPVLVMARQLAQADLQAAVRFGVRDCLIKPFSGAELVTRLSRLMKKPLAAAA